MSLTGLAERTGAIAFDGKRWDWTDAGHKRVHASLETLSPNAVRVLAALLDSSDGNGDDFGFMCEARESLGMESHAFAGHVSHLQHWIEWTEDLAADPGVECNDVQYGLTQSCLAARDEITALAAANAPAVVAPSLEHDLRSMVVRLEATAQLCGDGAGGLARAAAQAKIAAQLRALLKTHGHDCAPCKVYSSSEEALAALTQAGG